MLLEYGWQSPGKNSVSSQELALVPIVELFFVLVEKDGN